jgi:hypothetical protein
MQNGVVNNTNLGRTAIKTPPPTTEPAMMPPTAAVDRPLSSSSLPEGTALLKQLTVTLLLEQNRTEQKRRTIRSNQCYRYCYCYC